MFLSHRRRYRRLEADYTTLEDRYDRLAADHNALASAAYQTDEALSASADAHAEAEDALAQARDRIKDLETEQARVRELVQMVRSTLAGDRDADDRLQTLDAQGEHHLVQHLFEVLAIRQGLDLLVHAPHETVSADLVAAAHRLLARCQDRADLLGGAT